MCIINPFKMRAFRCSTAFASTEPLKLTGPRNARGLGGTPRPSRSMKTKTSSRSGPKPSGNERHTARHRMIWDKRT